MRLDLSGRVAVVTGGCSGIGRATALLLAQSGARVVGGDWRVRDDAVRELEPLGVEFQSCDVRRESDVEGLMTTAARGQGIDILVHSAGIVMVGQIPEMSVESWDACLDTNPKGAFNFCRH